MSKPKLFQLPGLSSDLVSEFGTDLDTLIVHAGFLVSSRVPTSVSSSPVPAVSHPPQDPYFELTAVNMISFFPLLPLSVIRTTPTILKPTSTCILHGRPHHAKSKRRLTARTIQEKSHSVVSQPGLRGQQCPLLWVHLEHRRRVPLLAAGVDACCCVLSSLLAARRSGAARLRCCRSNILSTSPPIPLRHPPSSFFLRRRCGSWLLICGRS